MKTQAQNKLDFAKNSIVELNNSQLLNINGGTASTDGITITTDDPNGTSGLCKNAFGNTFN